MKILMIDHPWDKSWLPIYVGEFEALGHDVTVWDGKEENMPKMARQFLSPDIVFCTWADRDFTEMFPKSRHVMMMRRFEFYHAPWLTYNWDKISLLVCCNQWIGSKVNEAIKKKPTEIISIRNSIDPGLWTFKERGHGKKIGMACRVHPVKNIPLAAQIMMELPSDYELHIVGPVEDPNIAVYMVFTCNSVRFYGKIPRKDLDTWWEDKNYCLSTSISEGDPMSVLEAMSKGIKPVIHNWPGASDMYETFTTAKQAAKDILGGSYDSKKYLDTVKRMNSTNNIKQLVSMVCKKGENYGIS